MGSNFTSRAERVTASLADLGLGAVVPGAYDDLVAADRSVDELVDRTRAGLVTPVDLDELAADLVAGKIKPETAGKRLTAPAGARVSNLLDRVRTAAVADADRAEWTPTALRRSVVPVVAERLKRTADDMLASIAGLPTVAKDHLTQVTEGDTVHYGPLTADQLAGLLDTVAPGRDLSSVSPDALAAVQRARSAWSWWQTAGDAFDAFYHLGTGQTGTTTYAGDRVGAGAVEADRYDPALLLLSGDDVDYVAAGLKLPYLVASGLVTELKPLADPYGDDAEAYRARVDRARQFVEWVGEARDTVQAGAAHLVGSEHMHALRQRARLNKLDAVAAYREHAGAKA
jgi:hypothetical protein